MDAITIKPHHFMDILKLYGGGIEVFVPDERMGHDFYRVANRILAEPGLALRLTVEGDDICQPCRGIRGAAGIPSATSPAWRARMPITACWIAGYWSCSDWRNKYTLPWGFARRYTGATKKIFAVWKEESGSVTQKRHDLFVQGAEKYIARWGDSSGDQGGA